MKLSSKHLIYFSSSTKNQIWSFDLR